MLCHDRLLQDPLPNHPYNHLDVWTALNSYYSLGEVWQPKLPIDRWESWLAETPSDELHGIITMLETEGFLVPP